jgi:hypothetical protein
MAKYILSQTQFLSDVRPGGRMTGPSTTSAGKKEALSVPVPDFGTMRVSVSPARQTGGFWQIPRPGWLSGEEVKREWHQQVPRQMNPVVEGIAHPDRVGFWPLS